MARRIAFIDSSGRTTPCSCVVLAGVAYEGSAGYLYAFGEYVDAIKRRYGISGELKWRELRRRGGASVVRELESRLSTAWISFHYEGEHSLVQALWSLMRMLRASLYVLDEGLVDPRLFPRTIARPSHKVPGIQLADLLAGYHRGVACRQ